MVDFSLIGEKKHFGCTVCVGDSYSPFGGSGSFVFFRTTGQYFVIFGWKGLDRQFTTEQVGGEEGVHREGLAESEGGY